MSEIDKESLVCLGHISGAHGINGEVLIKSYTEFWEDIGTYGPLLSADGSKSFELGNVRVTKKGVVARVKGVRYRDQAEALKGQELYVQRSCLPEEDDEETWYHVDLIGLKAVDVEGNVFGEVLALPNFGAGDIVEIRLIEDGKTLLVPFTKECVPEVDIAAGTMMVIPPEEDSFEEREGG